MLLKHYSGVSDHILMRPTIANSDAFGSSKLKLEVVVMAKEAQEGHHVLSAVGDVMLVQTPPRVGIKPVLDMIA